MSDSFDSLMDAYNRGEAYISWREDYNRSSWDILSNSSYDIEKMSKIEEEYCLYYKKISSIYLHSTSNVSMLKQLLNNEQTMLDKAKKNESTLAINHIDRMIINYKSKLFENEKQIEQCKILLASLESTTPIKNILQRTRKPKEIITLSFLNSELPNIPYNVICSQPQYLTNEEIYLIKCMESIEILPSNQTKNTIKTSESLNIENVQIKMKQLKQKEEERINREIENKRNRSKNFYFLVNFLSPIISIVLIILIATIVTTIFK